MKYYLRELAEMMKTSTDVIALQICRFTKIKRKKDGKFTYFVGREEQFEEFKKYMFAKKKKKKFCLT